jgi:hypothetical protein
MSLAQIRPVVEQFVSDKEKDMLVIKGGWGVGKTYFWQNLIRKSSGEGKIGYRYYAYVSLFGINSLEELKNSILASRIESKSVNAEGSIRTVLTNAKQLLKDAENMPLLREWTGGMASTVLFLRMKETLICFDDIERMGDGLDTKDVIGLASLLKDQRNCKIAFILNEGTMLEDEQESFRRHGEKIIDIELEFSPLPEEVFDHIFHKSHPHYDLIKTFCLTLDIKNIRILQRIGRFTEGLLSHLEGSEVKVVENALRSLILYVWSYYDRDGSAIPFDYVLGFNSLAMLMRKHSRDHKESAEEKRWGDILHSYGYTSTDDLDQHIAAFVKKGYLDETSLALELEKKNNLARAQHGEHSLGKAWDLYTGNFDDNEQEFVDELVATFRANMEYLAVRNLQTTVEMLRDLERDDLADSLIREYFDKHADDPDLIKMRHYAFINDIKDSRLVERLQAVWRESAKERTLTEVLRDLSGRNGWGPEDVELLAAHSVDDYYNFFKSERSDSLYFSIRTCLRFGEFDNAGEKEKAIAAKAVEALKRIASESRINRLRVEGIYKIRLDDKPAETEVTDEIES